MKEEQIGAAGKGPLSGVRIIDMTTVLMGPFATQILGDYGADVIKVEALTGDVSRNIGPMRNDKMGHFFLNSNRNKRSIALDLKVREGVDVLLKLARTADVVVTNIRPAALARLGISYQALTQQNPKIILVNLVGYGQKGRYAAKAAYDDLIQGAVGIPTFSASAGASEPRYAPLAMADRIVALHAVNAIVSALYSRSQTGEGQELEIPMFESLVEFVLGDHLGGFTFSPPNGSPGYQRLLSHDRRPYATRDGYICVLVYTDSNWRDFLAEIGKPDLFEKDPRFATIRKRTENISALYAMVSKAMPSRTTEEWLETFERLDIPAMPLHTVESLVEDPHLHDVGFFRIVNHPTEGMLREMAVPASWSKTTPSIRRHAPQLGEHSREILAEAGYSSEKIDEFVARRVASSASTSNP